MSVNPPNTVGNNLPAPQPAAWGYSIDPATGISEANYPGEVVVAGGTVYNSAAFFNSNVTVGGALLVSGSATFNNTVSVLGNTSLSGALNVAGNSTLTSASITNNAQIGGSLSSGATSVNSLNINGQSAVTTNGVSFIDYICILGDSITQNGIYTYGGSYTDISPSPWFQSDALNNHWRPSGWEAWIGPLSLQRAQILESFAVQSNGINVPGTSPSGWDMANQITRMLQSPNYPLCNRVIVELGQNDGLQNGGTPFTVCQVLKTQLQRIENRSIDLISIFPNASNPTLVTGGGMQLWLWLTEFRKLVKELCDSSYGTYRFIDAYSLGNTPLATPDTYAAGLDLPDGIHPNNAYAFKVAQAWVNMTYPVAVAGAIDIWPNQSNFATAGAANLIKQAFANPCFGVSSGGTLGSGATGTVAGSFTLSGINTGTVVGSTGLSTIPYSVGNMQEMNITSLAAGDGAILLSADVHAPGGTTFLNVGDQCWGQCLVLIGNTGNIFPRNLELYLNGYAAPNNYFEMCFEDENASGVVPVALPLSGATSLLLRTPVYTANAGVTLTNMQLGLRTTFAGAGNCPIYVSNFEIRSFESGTYNYLNSGQPN